MGQAKQRGTFEERRARAIVRNNAILMNREKLTVQARKFLDRHGPQRLVTAMAAAGLLSPEGLPKPRKGV